MSTYIKHVAEITGLIGYVGLVTSFVASGLYLVIEKDRHLLGAIVSTLGVAFFVLTFAAFVTLSGY